MRRLKARVISAKNGPLSKWPRKTNKPMKNAIKPGMRAAAGGIPGLPGLEGFESLYYMVAAVLTISIGVVAWIIKAPIGVIWRGISENEKRLTFFGYDTAFLKALAFGISGVLGGVSNGLLYKCLMSVNSIR